MHILVLVLAMIVRVGIVARINGELRRARLRVLSTHLQRGHHGGQILVMSGISGRKAGHPIRRRWGAELGLGAWSRSRTTVGEVRLKVGDGKTNFLDEAAVSLGSDDLQLDEDALRSLDVSGPLRRINEGAREDLVDHSHTIHLIAQDIGEHVVRGRVEQSIDDLGGRQRLHFLVHDAQDGQRRELVSAKVRKVRGEARRQEKIARGEAGRIEQPGEKKCTVRVRGQRNGVQDDRSRNASFLANSHMRALQASPHGTSAETALSNVPQTIYHGIEDEVIGGLAEPQAASEKKNEVSLISSN